MSTLEKRITVNDGSTYPLYAVTVNDGGPDGGSNSVYNISTDAPGTVATANLEAAVQAFAASLDALPGFTLTSVKKITVSETTL